MSESNLRGQMKVRSAFEVRPLLHEYAIKIGDWHGVVLGVAHVPGQGLFFVNALGDIVRDGPVHLLCCSEEEIATGDFLKIFHFRANHAALCEAYAQDYARRQMGGIN